MMRNKGRPLSRTMIVEHVWDMDYDGLTNIVDVYIRHLRSKIDDKWPHKMIQNVRGIGYMLDAPERDGGSAISEFRASASPSFLGDGGAAIQLRSIHTGHALTHVLSG